ncbi:E3 ubiquitin-protein ligase CIP8-like [Andrographis paniculata]|uniref:E3 ubiquitin-protein ligase CIP8-like n=1 Tax=Andrographis paniculata TaxID=175694 RepID=UPI0021E85AA7|nr:E3 ubiquitin-protein ligase CIP8-like [Andrographis paniculata]
MAWVTNLHLGPPSPRRPVFTVTGPHEEEPLQQDHREFYHHLNPFAFDFELFSHPNRSSNPSFFDDYNVAARRDCDERNSFYIAGEDDNADADDDDDEEQMNFVTNLFESRQTSLVEDPNWERNVRAELSPPEFGFGPGLRVVNMDSESDSEDFEVTSAYIDDYEDSGINIYHSNGNEREEELGWEEVSERIHSDEGEDLNSLISRIEELSVSSDISDWEPSLGDDLPADEELRRLEWQLLLAANNLERELENLTESRSNEDYIMAGFDTLLGTFVENETAAKGSPPAAKSAVESLPTVVVTTGNGGLVCAICKDDFVVGEKATQMPCGHRFHGGCIFPWLRIRNTCPVCRHELPTDDADYEKRRRGRGGVDNDRIRLEVRL